MTRDLLWTWLAYINEYDNLIQYVNIGGTITARSRFRILPRLRSRGLEFLIDYTSGFKLLNDPLGYSFGFNYSLIDAKDLWEPDER